MDPSHQQTRMRLYNGQQLVKRKATGSNASPQLKRLSAAVEIYGSQITTPDIEVPTSVQQAREVLRVHGINPGQLNLQQDQTLETQTTLNKAILPTAQSHRHGEPIFPQSSRPSGQVSTPSLAVEAAPVPQKKEPPKIGSTASQEQSGSVLDDRRRLATLFTQLIKDAGLKPIETLDHILDALPAPIPNEYHESLSERPQKRQCLGPADEKVDTPSVAPGTVSLEARAPSGEDQTAQPDTSTDNVDDSSETDDEDTVMVTKAEIYQLQDKVTRLQREVMALRHSTDVVKKEPPRSFVLHRVRCECNDNQYGGTLLSTFLDSPSRMIGDRRWHLQGRYNAPNELVFLEEQKSVVLLVYKDYRCKTDAARFQWQGRLQKHLVTTKPEESPPSSTSESILINSEILKEALIWATSESQSAGTKPDIAFRKEIRSPYHYFYHDRVALRLRMKRMDEEHQTHLKILMEYVEESFKSSYQEANELFSQGLVSYETIRYLFEPLDVVISQDGDETVAHRAKCWLEEVVDDRNPSKEGIELRCWSWKFDGSLRKVPRSFRLDWSGSRRDVLPIRDLSVYPLKYAEPGLEEELRARGEKFWSCTNRIYISYNDENMFGDPAHRGARYMIDTAMFKQLNPAAFPKEPEDGVIEIAAITAPPPNDFFLLLPSKIFGFSMQTKRWVSLKVACISPVVWNMQAFDSLVVDEDTKELVKALVTNQLTAEKATDLMEGKGNGLVILLHGGPGTGKTLTAESVAELARKPLYRVTCGDIGINADAIDKHLQRVLHLGRHWGCVVLLDEADVFLEERTLADMQRNALVSVFLRVLEYYDGILILTSNRVGTFDEAFKSRIQLALHYENLTRSQRRAIWANFFNRLEEIEKDNVNIYNLREHLDELAGHDMNGRQIRNALTTARQLALYKEKKMDYGLLRHAISVAGKFDNYLKNVKHNFSDDELAREGGVR